MKEAVEREWVLLSQVPDLVREISMRHGLTIPAAKTLVNREITDPREVELFLKGTLSEFPDPSLLNDVDKASERLVNAGIRREPLLIYADYDADGATGAACLFLFLKEVFPEQPLRIHQNDRLLEGYGIQERVIAEAALEGCRLVVTVDCGITDCAQIREAAACGVEVIVTDHHLPGETLPEAYAVIDPYRQDCNFPFRDLAGVGVAFFLVCGIRRNLREKGFFNGCPEPSLKRFLDLVALGTVADMVSLTSSNRLLVREGIREIRKSARPGIEALFSVSGASVALATEADLGFKVGPRLNAAGRIGDSSRSSRILVSCNREESDRLARELNEDNTRRQREQERILSNVISEIDLFRELPDAIVLSDPAWHQGVLGIVASKILDLYGRPVILLREEAGVATGSCRSVEGFPVVSALSELSHLLMRYGGHSRAAGVALPIENLELFRDKFSEIAARHAKEAPFLPRCTIDSEIRIEDIGMDLLADLNLLRPFGMGNPEPVFLLKNIRVARVLRMGASGQHLRFELEEKGKRVEGVAFNRAKIPADPNGRTDLLVTVQENLYRGTRSVRLVLQDARESGRPLLCAGMAPG
ncbi:MAG: single-stranded-DNA-specific exonuclease RecJ [Syntrophorhabdaceae bacterium]|nr:single-stranded-DNA-specific exonuclease RecJ [Syntrophorhabdaceae bacterium]